MIVSSLKELLYRVIQCERENNRKVLGSKNMCVCVVGILLPHHLRKVGVDYVGWSNQYNWENEKKKISII